MQRQLHQSLRLFCRQACHRRLYSAQATATARQPPEALPSSSAAGSSEAAQNVACEDASTKPKAKKKRRGEMLLEEVGISADGAEALLASLRAEGIEPTVEDLSTLEPKYVPRPSDKNYVDAYLEHRDRLCRSFSKSQLQKFTDKLQLTRKPGRKKFDFADTIMEKYWGWESLGDVEKARRDRTEISKKTLPISAGELFLLLGKDGSQLLHISREFNVHISVNPKPLALNIEGFRGSVKKLSSMIAERKKKVVEELVELPTKKPLSISLLRQISRTADAFVENVGFEGNVRICSDDTNKLSSARRIVIRAALEVQHLEELPFIALLPDSVSSAESDASDKYALFPFVQQHELPWTSASGDLFRARRLSYWLGDESFDPSSLSSNGTGVKGTIMDEKGLEQSLEELIRKAFAEASDTCTITASTGHLLIMRHSQQRSILPPFAGRWRYSEFMRWMEENKVQRVFVPSLPKPLRETPPTDQRIVHRLLYRQLPSTAEERSESSSLLPTKTIHAEVTITRVKPENSETENAESRELDALLIDDQVEALIADETKQSVCSSASDSEAATSSESEKQNVTIQETDGSHALKEIMTLEEDSSYSSNEDDQRPSEGMQDDNAKSETIDEDTPEQITLADNAVCTRSRELELLLALPDRPTDLKMTIFSSPKSLPLSAFPSLETYFSSLKVFLDPNDATFEPPEPPLFLLDGEDRYVLSSNSSVRQSNEGLSTTRVEMDNELTSHDIPTTTESVYDLETKHKAIHCEVKCDGIADHRQWISYLNDLDEVTSRGYHAPHSLAQGPRFNADDDGLNNQVTPPPEFIL